MKSNTLLNEEAMLLMEAHIPELAVNALRRAYYQALTTSGKVLEVRNDQLVETTVDGQTRIIRNIAKSVAVKVGTIRLRSRRA